MKKFLIAYLSGLATLSLFIGLIANAQSVSSPNYWRTNIPSSTITPINASLQVPCANIVGGCGGGGSSTISINGVSSTVFTLNSSTYLGITASGTAFTFTNLGVTTTVGNWAGTWQGVNSSTFLTTSTASTTYVPYTGANANVNLGSNSLSAASGTLTGTLNFTYTNASGTFTYSLKNDGNYLEINDTTSTIPGTSPVPYNIILQNCPPVSTTSTAVTSSSWECALSQAENFPDGSRSFVDWDTEYYPTGTGANIASGWFDNKRGTSSVEFPFELSWNDGSVNHVGFSMTPATNTSASNFNTLDNNGTGYFTVGTASSTTGAFDVYQNGGNTCAGIYDSGASTIYGLTDSLPAPAGCTALGGYYHGLAIGGSTANAGSPIFGVLAAGQSSNGIGHTAMTVYDTNEVDTFNNQLDSGGTTGNAFIKGNLNASGTITQAGVPVCTTSSCAPSSTVSSQWTTNGSGIYYNGGNVVLGTTVTSTFQFAVGANLATISSAGVIGGAYYDSYGAGTAALPAIYRNSNANTGFWWPGGSALGLTAAGTNEVYVTSAGVTIGNGTTTPANTLDVKGSGDFQTGLAVGTTTTSTATLNVNGGVGINGSSSVKVVVPSGSLLTGGCNTATTSIWSGFTTSTAVAFPMFSVDPGNDFYPKAIISAPGVLTAEVCADAAGSPATTTVNIKLFL